MDTTGIRRSTDALTDATWRQLWLTELRFGGTLVHRIALIGFVA